ncbi:MAG: hypothetical protein H8E32_06435 [Nitrospinae bacterium]|nr:hypothetical protein [Nitrospinota bacterium]
MQSFTALVRPPGTSFPQAISSHPAKKEIDLSRARAQHQSYVEALKQAGAKIHAMPPEDSLPDSTFVEDTAFIFGDTAYLCCAKEETRRNEVESVAEVLKGLLNVVNLEPYIDGGDILSTPEAIYIGLSQRSNERAIQSLAEKVNKEIVPVPVLKGLHLKSAVSYLDNNVLLINTDRVDGSAFKKFKWIEVEEKDSYAANCLILGDKVLMPAGFQSVREKIREQGFETFELEMSEFEKADGGVTCLSIILP